MATILFIDDDEQVRGVCQTILEAAGYCVLIADTGHRGLQLSEEYEVNLALIEHGRHGNHRTASSEPTRLQDYCNVRRLME